MKFFRSTLEKRSAPPRMFCDICDQFDLHETEDCPRQSQDAELEQKDSRKAKKSRIERPYCENCEGKFCKNKNIFYSFINKY